MSSTRPKAELSREQTIDRYGELDEQIERFAPVVAEHKALRARIAGWLDATPAGQPAILKGRLFSIQASARKSERTIVNPGRAFALLRKALGSLDAVVAVIRIPLEAAVDKFIPTSQHSQFLREEQTGSRTLKAVRNEAASKAA